MSRSSRRNAQYRRHLEQADYKAGEVPISKERFFGYDAVDQGGRRKQASPHLRSEDLELNANRRKQLVAQSRDMMRNLAIAGFAIRKHLDFVARFRLAVQTKTSFDTEAQLLWEEWANSPELCDITARHTFPRMVRMAESRAVIDGDCLLLPLKTGQLQFIESDRVRSSLIDPKGRIYHGVRVNEQGRALGYQVHRRGPTGSGYEFERELAAKDVLFHGYFPTERADQVRGISPIAAGINNLVDAYEWADIAKATEKVRAAFAMIVKSANPDGVGTHTIADVNGNRYDVEFGKGPFKLEMDPHDSLEFLSSQTPAGATVEFFKGCIGVALKSLDIPLCFYDETLTNFFGQRAQFLLYIESCKTKRNDLRTNILHPNFRWKVAQWVAQGRLTLPAGATSMTIDRLPFSFCSAGMPYWNPVQEITAQLMAIRGGLANYEDVYLETTGRDWFEDMKRLGEQQKFLIDNKINLDPNLAPVMAAALYATIPQQHSQGDGTNPLSQLPAVNDMLAV